MFRQHYRSLHPCTGACRVLNNEAEQEALMLEETPLARK
jgi:hypothetical protein